MIRNSNSGFGLIEVLIASAILAMVVGGNAALSSSIAKGLRKSSAGTTASELLNEGAEELRNIRDTALLNNDPTDSWSTYLDSDTVGNPVVPNREYRVVPLGNAFRLEAGRETAVRNGLSFERFVTVAPITSPGTGLTTQGANYRHLTVTVVLPADPAFRRTLTLLLTNWKP